MPATHYMAQGRSGANTVRCNGCRGWLDAKLSRCPHCQRHRPGFNKHLRTGSLNGNLQGQVASAEREKSYERALGG